jgi:hypothetical protein
VNDGRECFNANRFPSEITMIRTPQLPQLNLSRSPYERPFFVDMEAFFDFSFWLSEELLELEARFKDKGCAQTAPQHEVW